MSYPPVQETPHQPAPPAPRPRPWLWIGAAALVLVASAGGVAFALSGSGEPANRAEQAAAALPEPVDAPTEALPTATPTPVGYKPKPSDFKLTAKITDKECFGSAGCNVSFRVDVEYSGLPLGESVTWLVIYEITGVEDAPEVGSLEMTGLQATGQEENVNTTSSRSKIALKVTSVESA